MFLTSDVFCQNWVASWRGHLSLSTHLFTSVVIVSSQTSASNFLLSMYFYEIIKEEMQQNAQRAHRCDRHRVGCWLSPQLRGCAAVRGPVSSVQLGTHIQQCTCARGLAVVGFVLWVMWILSGVSCSLFLMLSVHSLSSLQRWSTPCWCVMPARSWPPWKTSRTTLIRPPCLSHSTC